MHGLLSAGTSMRRGVQRKGESNCKMSYTSVSGSVSGGVRTGERDLGGRSGERGLGVDSDVPKANALTRRKKKEETKIRHMGMSGIWKG